MAHAFPEVGDLLPRAEEAYGIDQKLVRIA